METMLPLTIKIIIDKRSKDAPYVAYTPELDVASCGPTEEKARKNLQEAVEIVIEELRKKGKQRWIPPRVSIEPFFFPSLS